MGLFSSVIHLRTDQVAAAKALDQAMTALGFEPVGKQWLTDEGIGSGKLKNGPYYLVSPQKEGWVTLVEWAGSGEPPWIMDVALKLSETAGVHTLALHLSEGDVWYYTLSHAGQVIDQYDSIPQYYENEPLSDEEIEQRRHHPERLAPFLPPGVTVEQVRALLDRGWWKACNAGQLDEDRVPLEEDPDEPFAEDWMTAFGTLLRLHGSDGEYPYTLWRDSDKIPWMIFRACEYRK